MALKSRHVTTAASITLLALSSWLVSSCRSDQEPGASTAPVLVPLAAAVAAAESGLDFPSNGAASGDIRFRFTGSRLQPMYPATYIWRYMPRRQAGYYTLFYWGPDGTFTGGSYYGPRPYPDGDEPWNSTSHRWGLSLNGQDVTASAGALGHDAWKTQALRVYDNGVNKVHEFYWDLPDTTKVIVVNLDRNYHLPRPSNAALVFGDAPWAIGQERLSGVLRGLQLYSASLTRSQILGEIASPLGTSAAGTIWYLNLNPTPSDITDKSGKGNHPSWASSARPALWTGDGGTPPPPTVQLAANPASVVTGGSSTLTWSSTNATSCAASGAWSGSKATSGSQSTGALSSTSTFTLTCTGAGGSAAGSATVTVTSAPPPPTVSLAANPTSVVTGGSSTLTWSSTNATSCAASGAWSGSKATSGSQSTGSLSATSTFTLTCTGAGGSAAGSATVTVTSSGTITGLNWPSNQGQGSSDIRLRFAGSARPPMYPATYIWRINPRQQSGYYTTFFWGPEQFIGANYYGAHPYPDNGLPSGTSHKWEVSIDGKDVTTSVNGQSTQLGYNVWRQQAFRAYDNGVNKVHEFYWDLPDTTKVIRVVLDRSYGNYQGGGTPVLNFGDAPWSIGNERLSGILRGIQLYSARLTLAEVLAEVNAPMGTPSGSAAIWYLNVNPTPSDVADKSGRGHHPAWSSSARPTLWTGP